ncbi:hypothetical protein COCON_G00090220 [Conger conger]|uniref:Uncharacterized protein n=1 Tax=Conger conger TaxID=82655 RepID=A0A9Q1DKT3_CONCO|nr:hypothetical protein COCON_G00090220 [Conger conger]
MYTHHLLPFSNPRSLLLFLQKAGADEGQVRKAVPDFCPLNGKLSDGESGRKAKSQPTLDFNRLYPDIKQEPAHTAIVHPSYFLYTYDKMVAPNVSLPSSLRKEDEAGPEALGALLKRHCSEARRRALSHEQDREQDRDRAADGESRAHSQEEPGARREARPVAMETGADEDAHAAAKDAGWEDDKDRMVLEIVQMYSRQQERLHSTLHKQMQLEMELEALRGGEAVRLRELSAERSELQSELEAVHTEHAQRLGEVRQEQRELERRLEQLRQQGCACEASSQREQEARYTAQLSELRRRLDRAEADREELQEELCREREAREKLELMISQLKEQMSQSTSAAEKPSPSPSPAPKTPAPAEGSPAQEASQIPAAIGFSFIPFPVPPMEACHLRLHASSVLDIDGYLFADEHDGGPDGRGTGKGTWEEEKPQLAVGQPASSPSLYGARGDAEKQTVNKSPMGRQRLPGLGWSPPPCASAIARDS